MDTLLDDIIPFLPMYRHRVTGSALVSFNKKPVLVSFVCHIKIRVRVLSVRDVPFEVYQVNSQHNVISGC